MNIVHFIVLCVSNPESMRNFLLISFLLFLFSSVQSQAKIPNNLIGNWNLVNVQRTFTNASDKDKGYYFFYDTYNEHKAIEINVLGKIRIWRMKAFQFYDLAVSQNEFKIIMYNADKSKNSYTLYEYKLEQGMLILTREDPMIKEVYTFKK